MKPKGEYTIYMHTAPNGKVYIGKTRRNPKERWAYGKGYVNNPHFYKAIQKYGWNNIKHEILETGLSKEEAYQSEIDFILIYQSANPKYGYNITEGGDGGFGVKKDPEVVRRTAQLASEKNKGRFVGRKSPKAKAVRQYTKQGELVAEYGATTEAASVMDIDYSNIVKCCTKKVKTCKGFLWFYVGDDTEKAVAEAVERASHIHFAPNQNENRLKALREYFKRTYPNYVYKEK